MKCPECGSELVDAGPVAVYCPNDDCPVFDDACLWDGRGNRKPGPAISFAPPAGSSPTSLMEWIQLIDDALETMELAGMHNEHSYQRLKKAVRDTGYYESDI